MPSRVVPCPTVQNVREILAKYARKGTILVLARMDFMLHSLRSISAVLSSFLMVCLHSSCILSSSDFGSRFPFHEAKMKVLTHTRRHTSRSSSCYGCCHDSLPRHSSTWRSQGHGNMFSVWPRRTRIQCTPDCSQHWRQDHCVRHQTGLP